LLSDGEDSEKAEAQAQGQAAVPALWERVFERGQLQPHLPELSGNQRQHCYERS